MRFSIDQLEMFSAVARQGSFSAAARAINKSQSTVSAAVANLEVDLGVELFDRQAKLPVLTPAGVQLLRQAELVLDRCSTLEMHAHQLMDTPQSELLLAIEIPYPVLVQPLQELSQQFPYLDVTIRHPMDGDVAVLVQKGEVDLGITFSQPAYTRGIAFRQMGKLILTHVVQRDHPLAQFSSISFAELREHRRLAFAAYGHRLPSTEYLTAGNSWKAESYSALLEMTRAGLGWTTLPRQSILREIESGELVELPLQAYPHTDWVVGVDLLWSQQAQLGKASTWLRQYLQAFKVFEMDRNGNRTIL